MNLHKSTVAASTSSKKSYPRSGSQRESSGIVTKDLVKKRVIILAVLRREIERLSIWRNPKMLPDLRVYGEDIVQGWGTQQPMTDRLWKDCIRVVWCICPHAAVHITLRYVLFFLSVSPQLSPKLDFYLHFAEQSRHFIFALSFG